MNRLEAELLQHSMENLSNTFQKNRELDEMSKYHREQLAHETARDETATERERSAQSRADAAQEHWQEMEDKQADAANQAELRSRMEWKAKLFQSGLHMNGTGQLDDESRENFNKWLSNDPDMSPSGLQIGKSNNIITKPGAKQSAAVATVNQMNEFRQRAQETDDEKEQASFNHAADLLEGVVKKMGAIKQPTVPMDTVTETQKFPGKAGADAVPGDAGGLFGGAKQAQPEIPAVPEKTITTKRHLPFSASSAPAAAVGTAPQMSTVPKYNSEQEARTAGHNSGDIVYITGVGKVRLQ